MAGDAFEETLAGFRRWAGTTDRKLNGDPNLKSAAIADDSPMGFKAAPGPI
jgi:hypothetical protein